MGVHKRVQSAGTFRPMLEPVRHKAQHQHGLWTSSVHVFKDGDTSPGRQERELLPTSLTQNQRPAKRVWKSATPGVWLYPCWSTNASKNTRNGWNIHPRVHKLLEKYSIWTKRHLKCTVSLFHVILWWLLLCFVVCHVAHVRLFIVSCVICKIFYINNIFFITVHCKEEFYYDFLRACVTIYRHDLWTFRPNMAFLLWKTINMDDLHVCDRFYHFVAQINN